LNTPCKSGPDKSDANHLIVSRHSNQIDTIAPIKKIAPAEASRDFV